jgi:sterol desaturase/sphingolipid hydroxylase (fatty acid hydroxylase superfamily)
VAFQSFLLNTSLSLAVVLVELPEVVVVVLEVFLQAQQFLNHLLR